MTILQNGFMLSLSKIKRPTLLPKYLLKELCLYLVYLWNYVLTKVDPSSLSYSKTSAQKQKYGSEFANELASKLQIIHNNARNQLQSSTKHMIREYSKKNSSTLIEWVVQFGFTLQSMRNMEKSYVDHGLVPTLLLKE